ncbi:MAG: hypothetical protein ABS85_00850 [Sphingobacteriales bacterium SCN 48-20]|uniref:YciI family protein n=1 Tax=Terrimonas ferruginea TaxID=249 RepID=UPI000869B5FA|nr:YciI family protein [Terrimonas ferruginea]MBN8782122.1 transcription initiation protein [Terrimonas ferruginea]ODT95619.1 MAG: hypothetical protein ABS85_00850 [Sphingobacteriales bacterium SCN 48-20]OJW43156.1 MAG: hypothetical protein BGO56_11450 [Sphingobacteriales bacterium 48-107]
MKEFLLLLRESTDLTQMTPEEMQADMQAHLQWMEELVQKGHFKAGNPLDTEGRHIRGTNRLVTDGPYVESKECISGFYFLLASSLEEATTIASGCPALNNGGMVEIREVIETHAAEG